MIENEKILLLEKAENLLSRESVVDLYRVTHYGFSNVNNQKSVDGDFDVRVNFNYDGSLYLSLECKIPIKGRKDVKGIDEKLRKKFGNWGSDSVWCWYFGVYFDSCGEMKARYDEIESKHIDLVEKQKSVNTVVKKMPSGFYSSLDALRLQCFTLPEPDYANRLLDIMLTHTK